MTTLQIRPDTVEMAVPAAAYEYEKASRSESTWRGYESDLRSFRDAGFEIPCSAADVITYISDQARAGYKASTIGRRLSSISVAHQEIGTENPTRHPRVKSVHAGIRRTLGTAPDQKNAISVADLRSYFSMMNGSTKDIRNRAMLVAGFAGAFRRSELTALNVEDLTPTDEGYRVRITRSKTDQEGKGRDIALIYAADPDVCPVRLLRGWMTAAGITTGPLFRQVLKSGRVTGHRIDGRNVAVAVKAMAEALELDPDLYGGHSLRRGFCTSAARGGASERQIMRQSGHRSFVIVRQYIEAGSLFDEGENAVHALGL